MKYLIFAVLIAQATLLIRTSIAQTDWQAAYLIIKTVN